ncbi:MAG: DUF7948 domain-containing protein, partial [Candidatus Latescibacterota bacterium]
MLLHAFLLSPSSAPAAPSLDANYGKIPLAFTLNEGQAPDHIRFTARGSGCGMAFSPSGTTFLLSRETPSSVARRSAKRSVVFEDTPETNQPDYETFALGLEFVGANENPEIVGEDRLPWNNNYFIGNDPDQWRTDVPNYGKIRFKEVYRGIDLVYYGNQKRVKYDFVVRPGEDPEQILLKYDIGGYEGSLEVNEKGELVVKTPVGEMIEEKPYCYQRIGGKEVEVKVGYEVVDKGSYRFRVGEYDGRYDLVIDPELVYSTYLGGKGDESVAGIAVDNEGCAYVTGRTESVSDYPITQGAFTSSFRYIFITKLNSSGTALLYSTFLGAEKGNETPADIKVDQLGNAYIVGYYAGANFPVTHGAFSSMSNSLGGFVTKLNSDGNGLQYSLVLGGSSGARIEAIILDLPGNAYITGTTSSVDFPTTSGAYDQLSSNYTRVFVSKVS